MARVFLIKSIVENTEANEQVNVIFRHLASRGNDVTLFDISHLDWSNSYDEIEVRKQMDLLNVLEIMETADAVVLVTDEYCSYLTQIVQNLFSMTCKKLKRSSNVWNHNGVCCTILGGSVRKSKVAKELWEVFQEQELDFTDLFPYGSPRLYNLDYTKETAQPTVV
ncbi:uncharacterized protein LOC130647834 [Hydractinia symbiolongicarpus]|uniref:uncharacterized protein LOC130647834 n=1 Tax=Hydractinia symbiolongicarpus TaxID=13093 RepID=UPI00254B202E|nr:uncharacterized protein LOC130647834 [Hydractinia symbiolongicarpus]